MISTLLFDFARVFLFAKDKNYKGELNALHKKLSPNPDYKFSDHFEFNEELLGYLEKIKGRIDVFMFTSGTIQEVPEIRSKIENSFKEIYSAQRLGVTKTDPFSYSRVAEEIGKPPEEILFIDDTTQNILAAQEANLSTILYQNNLQLINDLRGSAGLDI